MPRPASKRCPAGAARVSEPGGALPGFLEFCDPTLRNVPPTGAEWLHEIKWDGYRAEVHLQSSRPKVFSRNGLDWTQQFAPIAKAVGRLEAQDAILDGEAVVLGRPVDRISRRYGASSASRNPTSSPTPPSTSSGSMVRTCGSCRLSNASVVFRSCLREP